MSGRRTVTVTLQGQPYRIRTDDDEAWLQRVASHLVETLAKVATRTGTADSRDAALLTALNLARELVALREGRRPSGLAAVEGERISALIELARAGLEPPPSSTG